MTKDEVILMAREAGFNSEDHHEIYANLMRFATLVATSERRKHQSDVERCKAKYQPLTKEQQFSVWSKLFGPDTSTLDRPYNSYVAHDSFYKVVSAIEAAHGIGRKQ